MLLPYLLLLPPLLLQLVQASSGDRSPIFTQCVSTCVTEYCPPKAQYTPSLPLRLTRWTCTDDCKYTCMHQITDRDLSHNVDDGNTIHQYYGKWPFWRLWGMQEPASVLFSLGNMAMHFLGASKISRNIPDGHPMKKYYLRWAYVSVNAWVWSSVFHTRDLPTTEKLDYFSAALVIGYALYYTILRVFHLYRSSMPTRLSSSAPSTDPHYLKRRLLAIFFTLAFLAHISYLTLLPRFDYTYNIVFNLTVGITHNLLWLIYSLPLSLFSILGLPSRFPGRAKSYRPSVVGQAVVFVLLTTMAMGLELFDFPPWGRIVDAHALWHLATVLIAALWYDFLIKDASDDSWRAVSIRKA